MMEHRKNLRQILGELAGYASLCWTPKPTGVFDSALAAKAVEESVAAIVGDEGYGAEYIAVEALRSENQRLKDRLGKAEVVIRGLVNSKVITEAPFASYSEALDLARDFLKENGEKKEDKEDPVS